MDEADNLKREHMAYGNNTFNKSLPKAVKIYQAISFAASA